MKSFKYVNRNNLAAAGQPGSRAMPKLSICHLILHLGKQVRFSNRTCGSWVGNMGLALVSILLVIGVGNIQYTHCQLSVLFCTTTWSQPGLSRGFIDKFQNWLQTENRRKPTAVFIEMLPQLKIKVMGFLWSSPRTSFHSKLMKLCTEDTDRFLYQLNSLKPLSRHQTYAQQIN